MPRDRRTEEPDAAKVASPVLKRRRGERSPRRPHQGQRRLRRMRANPAWQVARAIPHTQQLERKRAFGTLRQPYGFSEYALHDAVKGMNCAWIADHVEAVVAQTLATRAYRALNRVCLGQARRVRFRDRKSVV